MASEKIAVHLYGHLRTFKSCAPSLHKHLISQYDCDVFIHTWDNTEHNSQSWYDEKVKSKNQVVNEDMVREIIEIYQPKELLIEQQGEILEVGHFGTHSSIQISLNGLHNALYSLRRSIEIRKSYVAKTSTHYDYGIVIRPDIMLHENLNLSKYQSEFDYYEKTTVHFLHNSILLLKDRKYFNYPLISDVFYLAKIKTIDEIATLEYQFDRYYKDINITFPAEIENPENGFFQFMAERAIVPRQYQFYFSIKRENNQNDISLLPKSRNNEISGRTIETSVSLGTPTFPDALKGVFKYSVRIFWKVLSPSARKIFLITLKRSERLRHYLEFLNQNGS